MENFLSNTDINGQREDALFEKQALCLSEQR